MNPLGHNNIKLSLYQFAGVQVDDAHYCQIDFIITQKWSISRIMQHFHPLLFKGAAMLDCKFRVIVVLPTLQLQF